jgi:hypothetical protein
MTTQPSLPRKIAINTLITSLKAAGIWSLLDVMYVMAANDSQAASLNWKNPATFALTLRGTPMFTKDRGYQGDSLASALKTGFTPSVNGVNYTQNSASAWAWCLANMQESRIVAGSLTAPRVLLQPWGSGNTLNVGINDANGTGPASTTSKGLFGVSRPNSTQIKAWAQGVAVSTQSVNSTAVANQEQYICGAGNGAGTPQYSLAEMCFAAWGADLGGRELSFYNALNTYMGAVLADGRWDGTPYVSFDETAVANNSYATVGSGILTYEYTQPWTSMSAIKLHAKPAGAGIIFSNATTSPAFPGYEHWIDSNGKQHVRLINNITTPHYIGVIGSQNLVDGLWHVVTATYDGSGTAAGVKLYVDGVQDTSATVESDTLAGNTIVGGTQTWMLGNQANHLDFNLVGGMSYFSLSNIVRSGSYIASHATSGTKESVDANHSIFFALDEGSGATLTDTSSGGHNATLNNPASQWRP